MDLRDTAEEAAFRAEVRRWLQENLPPDWGRSAWRAPAGEAEKLEFTRAWQRKLYQGGWAGLSWPREYGGRGASVMESVIYREEYARARAPDLINLGVGIALTGPTLLHCGAEWQKKRFIEPILKADEIWCQGFSEPNAGSDLAALRTRGEVRGDEIVVTGQKIWTSFAEYSDWCILVVRTNPEAPKHKGLTFLLCDMNTPGIDVRPLKELTGEVWFNEVFFDQVRIPIENVVGEIDGGWNVVIATLNHERVGTAPHGALLSDLKRLIEVARRTPYGNGRASEDPVIRQKLARCATEAEILRMSVLRNTSEVIETGQPGPMGSTLKLFWSELDQRVKDLAIEILGLSGLAERGDPSAADDGYWLHELLWSRGGTIYAGTSEIQRNIIAQRVLGLPRA